MSSHTSATSSRSTKSSKKKKKSSYKDNDSVSVTSQKKKKKHKDKDKDKDDGYFKRSYTVHGLSSAARKLRRSFGKGSQKSLNKVGLGNQNFLESEMDPVPGSAEAMAQAQQRRSDQIQGHGQSHSHGHQAYQSHGHSSQAEYLAANVELIRGKHNSNSSNHSGSSTHNSMAHKPLKKFTTKGTHGKYHDQNKNRSVDLSRGQNSQAKNITMHQLLVVGGSFSTFDKNKKKIVKFFFWVLEFMNPFPSHGRTRWSACR